MLIINLGFFQERLLHGKCSRIPYNTCAYSHKSQCISRLTKLVGLFKHVGLLNFQGRWFDLMYTNLLNTELCCYEVLLCHLKIIWWNLIRLRPWTKNITSSALIDMLCYWGCLLATQIQDAALLMLDIEHHGSCRSPTLQPGSSGVCLSFPSPCRHYFPPPC
jgi:hypothetical protein